jgi:4-amino-4-deoxy-L-arabinose transferase-like glycosyltransferase
MNRDHPEHLYPSRRRWLEALVLGAILLLAAMLRLYRLEQLPPGLHYDEAFNATMAHRVLTGIERPIFFTEDMTEEPMAIYAAALSFALFGETPWALRLVSALAGILTIAAVYAFARTLFQSPFTAGLAALTLAILYWHVNFSRLGMEPIFTPLMMTLAFALLWRALARSEERGTAERVMTNMPRSRFMHHVSFFALSGVFFAATLYTYKAALFVPILIAAFVGMEVLIDREFWMQNGRGLVILVIVAVLVFSPLGIYLATHPAQFFERPGSVVSPNAQILADNALRIAGMFFLQGDDNPRSNLPGRPALDPFLAVGFIVGVIACIARIRQRKARVLLLWLGVMVLPSGLTDFAPHFGRSIGVTPAIALIVAYGLGIVVHKAESRKQRAGWLLPTAYCLLFIGLAFSTFATVRDYFAVWGARTGLFDSFDVGYLTLAEKLRARPGSEALYLSPVDKDYYTIQFGLARRAARSFDGRRVLVVPPAGVTATYGIVTREDARSIPRLAQMFADARVLETIADYTAMPYATIYRVQGAPRLNPQTLVNARLGDVVELIGYDSAREGDTIVLTVYWGCLAEMREDYTVFVHWIGAFNPTTQSPVWAQDDTRPGRGTFPTLHWQNGVVVVDEYRLTLPPKLPRGEYQIAIGMYNLETGARVQVVDANGAPMESNRVIFERVSLP